MIDVSKTITPLLWRVIVFLCLFVVISGTFGPRIISGGILFRDGFAFYGGLGKAMIFGLIAFVLLARHNRANVILQPWQPLLLGWGLASLFTLSIAWSSISYLLMGIRDFRYLLFAHGGLILGLVMVALACIGLANLQRLWHSYKREIIQSAAITGVFYLFLLAVYALWQPLATVVLHVVKWLTELTGLTAIVVPPNTLIFDKFGVTIAEYCSGVESIALFTGLYVIVGILDWKRLNQRRFLIVFPFALLGLFAFNILRVFGLIMAGYHIDPQIAFSLFHTYAGMVFFILYSAIFWSIAYKFLIRKPQKKVDPQPTISKTWE